MSGINQRKIDHVNLVATHEELDRERGYFDRIHLTHRALPEQNLADQSQVLLNCLITDGAFYPLKIKKAEKK